MKNPNLVLSSVTLIGLLLNSAYNYKEIQKLNHELNSFKIAYTELSNKITVLETFQNKNSDLTMKLDNEIKNLERIALNNNADNKELERVMYDVEDIINLLADNNMTLKKYSSIYRKPSERKRVEYRRENKNYSDQREELKPEKIGLNNFQEDFLVDEVRSVSRGY